MYAESLSFDPISQKDEGLDEKGLLQNHATTCGASFSVGVELQQQLNLEMGKFHSSLNCEEFGHEQNNTTGLPCVHPNWGEMGFNPYNQQLSFPISSLISSNPSNFIANCTDLQKSSTNFLTTNPSSVLGLFGGTLHQRTDYQLASTSTNLFYEPLQLNMPVTNLCTPQSSLFKDLFHLSPHGSSYGLGSSGTGSLFSHGGVAHEEEVTGALYHDGSFHDQFSGDMINSAAIKKREGKDIRHHASEKQRRVHFSDKFQALRALIPNPSKNDRATIIGDAIGYINELKMRVNELKNEVDLRKLERIKRQRIVEEDSDAVVIMEAADQDQAVMNKSWKYQRKSKNNSTEVDVRVMEDEVTVKLVQQMKEIKRMNCLVFVSKALDELHLDLQHVAGGLIGDHYSYLFNSKISEGSTVYASAIANK
ncbi:hypothetical protein HAX54_014853, partial [Datura stramonium]|nr:hypothetical protein [Datura stramonium]